MKREIKFRGKSNKGLVYGYYIYNNFNEPVICNEDGAFLIEEKTLGQFTGLKDKNGKEIYEGDIVKVIVGTKSKTVGAVTYGGWQYSVTMDCRERQNQLFRVQQ